MDFFDQLALLPPALVWGVVARGIGLVYVVSFASLSAQVIPIAGRNGIAPVGEGLRCIERDFPTWKRFVYFPTLLWFGASDRALWALPRLGLVAAATVVVGGPHTPWALFACYLLYLSLDRAMNLVYPWDCVLLEAGLWGALLPATHLLPDVTAVAAPDPAIAWVFRLLVFRVMFGFGKHKFFGATGQDTGYLKGFYISQPIPSIIGWYSHRLPMWMLKSALWVMFLAEVPGPFTVFFPGRWCALAAVLIVVLMIGIWAGGTFGFFNLMLIVLAVSWFDSQTAAAFGLKSLLLLREASVVHALVLMHVIGVLVTLPFNTFCAHTWMLWPVWLRAPRILTWPTALIRALHPLRWLHAYGVFPPHSPPAAKMVPTLEVTWDEREWHPVALRYWPVLERSRPRFCAPHHPRIDQAVLYEAFGVSEASVLRNFMGRWDPYGHGRVTGGALVMKTVLEGNAADGLLGDPLLASRPDRPTAARMRSYLLEAASLDDARRGQWWRRELVGPHLPPVKRDNPEWQHLIPLPELWHPEDLIWLRRSRLGPLLRAAARGVSPHDLVLQSDPAVTARHVDAFWAFVEATCRKDRSDWQELRATVMDIRARHDAEELHRLECLAGRYAAMLSERLDALFVGDGLGPALTGRGATLGQNVKTHHHLRLLAYDILSDGRDAYDAVMANPRLAVSHADRMTLASGSYLLAVFGYEGFVFQSQKLRAHERFNEHEGRPAPTIKEREQKERAGAIGRRLWGVVDMLDFLKTRFQTPADVLDVPERWPRFRILPTGEVVRIEETTPPAPGDSPDDPRALAAPACDGS